MLQNFYTSIKMFYNRLIYDIMSSDIISAHIGFGGTAKSRALKICRGYYTRKDLGRQDINAMNFEEIYDIIMIINGQKKLQDLSKEGRE